MKVYLLYGIPVEAPWEETLIAIYGDIKIAEKELKEFLATKNWSSLTIETWQVKTDAGMDNLKE